MHCKPKKIYLGILILLFFYFFFYIIAAYKPPIGDDVLYQFQTGVNFYIDSADNDDIGDTIQSLPQCIHSLRIIYMSWAGRMMGYVWIPFISMFGQKSFALLEAFFFCGMIFAASQLVCNTFKQTLNRPLILLIIGMLTTYYSPSANYLVMSTFTGIYVVSVFFYCLYYRWECKLTMNGNKKLYVLVLLNILGFLAGLTHELIGALFGVMLFVFYLINRKTVKISFGRLLLNNIGFLVGFSMCFFAPGNFARARSNHDAGILAPYMSKLRTSILVHLIGLKTNSNAGMLVMLFLILVAAFFFFRATKTTRIHMLKECAPMIAACFVSVFSWAFVSYVPSYGVQCTIVIFVVALLKIISMAEITQTTVDKNKWMLTLIPIVICIAFVGMWTINSLCWMPKLISTSNQWEALIADAKEAGEESVVVPMFPEETNNIYTFYNYNNNPDNFTYADYRKFYGILVIPK